MRPISRHVVVSIIIFLCIYFHFYFKLNSPPTLHPKIIPLTHLLKLIVVWQGSFDGFDDGCWQPGQMGQWYSQGKGCCHCWCAELTTCRGLRYHSDSDFLIYHILLTLSFMTLTSETHIRLSNIIVDILVYNYNLIFSADLSSTWRFQQWTQPQYSGNHTRYGQTKIE